MKRPVLVFIGGIVAGTISAYGSIFIAASIINKQNIDKEREENKMQETVISKIRSNLKGTEHECFADQYIAIINKAREIFPNDYSNILCHLNNVIDKLTENQNTIKDVETLIVAIDILSNAVDA